MTLDEMIRGIGPDFSGFDQIMSGVVPPQNTVIDVQRFGEALNKYAEAVDVFERFAGEKPEGYEKFKALPRQMLDSLRAFHGPLTQSQGREFDGAGQMVGQVVDIYSTIKNEGSSLRSSQLRFLP